MLDFFSIWDSLTTPEYPEEHPEGVLVIGSVSLQEHKLLIDIFERSGEKLPFSYFQDTRLRSTLVKRLADAHSKLLSHVVGDVERKVLSKYLEFVETAIKEESGIITFCD